VCSGKSLLKPQIQVIMSESFLLIIERNRGRYMAVEVI
jgi:hypothetical protein